MATPFLGRRGSLGSGDTLPPHLSSPRLYTDVSPHSGAGPANPGAASLCPPGPARSSLLSPPPLTPSGGRDRVLFVPDLATCAGVPHGRVAGIC